MKKNNAEMLPKPKKNIGGLLSMCRRAGKLSAGMDMVKGSCNNAEALGVYVADDISEKTLKEVKYVCYKNGIALYALEMSMQQVADSIGKRVGVLAICDKGFNKKASSSLQQIPIDETMFSHELDY